MKRLLTSMMAGGLFASLAATVAQAAVTRPDEGGATAAMSLAICGASPASAPTEFCNSDADAFVLLGSVMTGGKGATSARLGTDEVLSTGGSAAADATVGGSLAVPMLSAEASSVENRWIGGQALMAQGYTYTGTNPLRLQLEWTLEGDIVNPDADPATGLVIFVGFFDVTSLSFPDVGLPFTLDTVLALLAPSSPVNDFLTFTGNGSVVERGLLSFDVDTGEQFYLVMGLMAGAGGADANTAPSTLTAAFAGSPALIPTITVVPLPSAAWMLLSGLGSLTALLRHRVDQRARFPRPLCR